MERVTITPGQTVTLEIGYSEVCMHLQVAGQIRPVTLLPSATGHNMAQIRNTDGSNYSFPVTAGEAGFYRDHMIDGQPATWYYYPPDNGSYQHDLDVLLGDGPISVGYQEDSRG